jgi:hypothetical protein
MNHQDMRALLRRSDTQLVSLLLRPIRTQTAPPINRARPKKSNSFTCCLSVIPLCGLRLRKKNKIRPAMPPVGLQKYCEILCHKINEYAHKLIQKHLTVWGQGEPSNRKL